VPEIVDVSGLGSVGGGSIVTHPSLPGTNISFKGSSGPNILPAASDTVGLPVTHDWGPIGADAAGSDGLQGGPQVVTSFAGWTGLFGDSDTPGRTAVAGAFVGQNLPGTVGCGAVWVYRMAGTTVAYATVTILALGSGTPPAITLQGYYKGSRGNRISYAIDNDPSASTKDRIRLYFDGVLQEIYVYDPTGADTIATLTAQINARSRLISAIAVAPTNHARLTQTPSGAPVALAAGDDGATVVSADHLGALTGLSYKPFGVLAPYDLTDSAIQAAYVSWAQAQAQANRPCRIVLGGAAGEDIGDAIAAAADLDDEHIIRVGGGTYHDDLLDKDLSTSQLASRIAGVLAACGETSSLTFKRMGGLHPVITPSDDEILPAVQGGVVVFAQTTSQDADLMIEKGVTSYTGDTASKPADVYGDARLIGIMDDYVWAMTVWGNETIIGDLPVNDDTRDEVYGYARGLQDDLLEAGLILPADASARPTPIVAPWVVCENPEDESLEDTIPYTFGWRFAKTANNIIGQGSVS
jgi:hypothetical protein